MRASCGRGKIRVWDDNGDCVTWEGVSKGPPVPYLRKQVWIVVAFAKKRGFGGKRVLSLFLAALRMRSLLRSQRVLPPSGVSGLGLEGAAGGPPAAVDILPWSEWTGPSGRTCGREDARDRTEGWQRSEAGRVPSLCRAGRRKCFTVLQASGLCCDCSIHLCRSAVRVPSLEGGKRRMKRKITREGRRNPRGRCLKRGVV